MGNELTRTNTGIERLGSSSITLQLAYLQNLTEFNSGLQNVDHSVRGRVWVDKPISRHWVVRGMLEALFRLQPLVNNKNLKPADYAGAGFPPRPSGVNSVDGVTVSETRRYSFQPAIDLFFLYNTAILKFGPRITLNGAFTEVESENIPQVKPTPVDDCKNSGDIYCVPDQPKPSPSQPPSVIQQNLNKAVTARIGGLLNYDPFSWLGVGLEAYLQTPIYNGGSTLVVLRPEMKLTLPLQRKWNLNAPDLFMQIRFPFTFDILKGREGISKGYDLFVGLQRKF